MNILRLRLPVLVFTLALCLQVAAKPPIVPNPDFTKGEPLPEMAKKDWTLGATGARGWMHTEQQRTTLARQIYITEVAKGSPADGVLLEGDALLGVAGQHFTYDPRTEMGKALTAAEAKDGKLSLIRWREGKGIEQVVVELPVLGSYSPTAPYNCPKSEKILERASEALAKSMQQDGYEKQNPIARALNGLGLLASGDPKYHSILKKEAEWVASYDNKGFATWYYGYLTVFLSEYILATGDKSVLPGLRRMVVEASEGQSAVGSWGHRFANPDGRLPGYGMMNSPGAVLTVGLVLAREAGVDDPSVMTAIQRSVTLLRFYTGKGSVPYGDHNPTMTYHDDNGKNGMVAVLFDLMEDAEPTKFFSQMSTASHSHERDTGHTGNFFNITWAMPGVSRGGPDASGAWMKEFGSWYFDLARNWDYTFRHQGPPTQKHDSYNAWDATGVYLIAYGMPRKAIRLTGSKASVIAPFDPQTAANLVMDGRESEITDLNKAFTSWSPIVRERAAKALAKRAGVPAAPFIKLLDAPALEARMGACAALGALGNRAAAAVPKLREAMRSDDLWLRVQAVKALTAIGEPAMVALPEILEMLAKGPTPQDPRAMEQRFLVEALFHPRKGMLRSSLDGVNRDLLLAAIKSGLQNQDGRTRGNFGRAYENLTIDELKPILPAIHQAILVKSPSGIMFDGSVQNAGLDLYSRNHVDQGIEMIVHYIRVQKPHGSDSNTRRLLNMLKSYGVHAQRAIPELEKLADYFEGGEPDFPQWASDKKAEAVRAAIKEIKQIKDKPKLIDLNL